MYKSPSALFIILQPSFPDWITEHLSLLSCLCLVEALTLQVLPQAAFVHTVKNQKRSLRNLLCFIWESFETSNVKEYWKACGIFKSEAPKGEIKCLAGRPDLVVTWKITNLEKWFKLCTLLCRTGVEPAGKTRQSLVDCIWKTQSLKIEKDISKSKA